MTIVAEMPSTIKCPSCGHEVLMAQVCTYCGFSLKTLHEKCPICGKPVGHGRHWDTILGVKVLLYYCGCGFVCTTREELDRHLREVR